MGKGLARISAPVQSLLGWRGGEAAREKERPGTSREEEEAAWGWHSTARPGARDRSHHDHRRLLRRGS